VVISSSDRPSGTRHSWTANGRIGERRARPSRIAVLAHRPIYTIEKMGLMPSHGGQ
jgi:hypothetical protein